MTFVLELVILRPTPSMFGKFVVHVWRQCGALNEGNFIKGQINFGMSLALNEQQDSS